MFKALARSSLRFTNSRRRRRRPPTSSHNSRLRFFFLFFFSSSSTANSLPISARRSLRSFAVLSIAPAAAAIAFSALALVQPDDEEGKVEDINRTRPTSPAGTQPSAFSLWPSSKLPSPHLESSTTTTTTTATMSSSTPIPTTTITPPGRPGNLTKEEEAKLKELWLVTLRVFGVSGPAGSEPTSPPSATPAPAPAPATVAATVEEDPDPAISVTSLSPDPRKKNRKSFGRFLTRKSRPEKETGKKDPPVQEISASIVAVDTSDDKYGQTADFKAALANQTPAELREAFWSMVKCDNPDGLLLRFLRARKWDVDKALVMMVATMNWRSKELNVQGVIEKGEAGYAADADQGFIKQLRMGKSFLHGCDKEGRPICLVRVRLHKQADQSEEALEWYTVYIMETARLMLRDPVDTAAVVFDMSGFSMANMDYAPVKYLIKCFEAHYPESLGICLVHKAPWIFQSIWSIIRGWLDPVVASKIHFTKSVEDMEVFIPRCNIIKELGGDDDWEYSYPEPESANTTTSLLSSASALSIRAQLQVKRDEQVKAYEALTRTWITAPNEGKASHERLAVAAALREGYWEMDPYLRARSVYDRTGVLGHGGKLDFYSYRTPAARVVVDTSADDID